MSKPELEALSNLVNLQTTKVIGKAWADYHKALLHTESVRHLTKMANALTALRDRANRIEENQHEFSARLIAQQQAAQRHAEQLAREADFDAANTFSASASIATTRPLILGYGPRIGLSEWASEALQTAIQRAVVRVLSTPSIASAIAIAAYSSTLGDGELKGASIPLYYLIDPVPNDWQVMSGQTAILPTRLGIENRNNKTTLYIASTAEGTPSPHVKVMPARWDTQKKYYWATLADTARTTLTWSPSSAPGGEVSLSPGLPIEQPVLTVYTGDVLSPIDPTLEIYPAVDDVDFRDYIIWFPQDSGLPPVYVMLKSPRDEPGVVTGVGSVVTGLWLNETTRGRGAPIPASIADQLRDKNFDSFDKFRSAFWALVGRNGELLIQFSPGNRGLIKRGFAPKALEDDWARGRTTFELHHVHEIQNGGDVYNLDNLMIVTPKVHINYHEASKP